MIICVCLLFVGNIQACNRPTLSPPKFSISAFNVIKDSVSYTYALYVPFVLQVVS